MADSTPLEDRKPPPNYNYNSKDVGLTAERPKEAEETSEMKSDSNRVAPLTQQEHHQTLTERKMMSESDIKDSLKSIHKELNHSLSQTTQVATPSKAPSPYSTKEHATELAAQMSILNPEESKKPRKKRKSSSKEGQSSGRWTEEEHQAFLSGLRTYGREWKKVASIIPTRTSAQVRSHAQKYFAKVQKDDYDALSSGTSSPIPLESMTPSVQANVERILRDPAAAQREVEDTLAQLRERYRQLQIRLAKMENSNNHDDNSTLSSLQNEELIALSVLHSGLSAGEASSDEDSVKKSKHE